MLKTSETFLCAKIEHMQAWLTLNKAYISFVSWHRRNIHTRILNYFSLLIQASATEEMPMFKQIEFVILSIDPAYKCTTCLKGQSNNTSLRLSAPLRPGVVFQLSDCPCIPSRWRTSSVLYVQHSSSALPECIYAVYFLPACQQKPYQFRVTQALILCLQTQFHLEWSLYTSKKKSKQFLNDFKDAIRQTAQNEFAGLWRYSNLTLPLPKISICLQCSTPLQFVWYLNPSQTQLWCFDSSLHLFQKSHSPKKQLELFTSTLNLECHSGNAKYIFTAHVT